MPPLSRWGEVFHITEEHEDIVQAVLTKGASLSGADRLLYESADYEVSGNAILQRHENRSPDGIPESLRVDNLCLRFPHLEQEQAAAYQSLMLQAGFTYKAAIRTVDGILRRDGIEETLNWLQPIAEAMTACDSGGDDLLTRVREAEAEHLGTPTYGWHKVGGVQDTHEVSWFDKQIPLVQRLLTTPQRCTSLEQLKRLGKGCYEASKAADTSHLEEYQLVYRFLSNAQQSVFWSNYRGRKRALTPRVRTMTAQSLGARIENAQGNDFRHLKGTLYKIQHGQLRLRDPPAEYEWSALWGQYHSRELQLGDTREIPEGHSRCGYCYISNGVMYLPNLREPNPPKNNPATNRLHCLSCQYF